ncbi:MAG: TIGR03013 family XrtA/PEP-CTERM system glycosyltransferase [Vicinamibacterales bacterium]
MALLARGLTWRRTLLVACEHALIVSAVLVAARLRLGPDVWVSFVDEYLLARAVLIAVVLQICLHYSDLYDLRQTADRRDLLTRLVQSVGAASMTLAFLYYWIPDLVIGRGVFLIAAGLIIGLVAGWRLVFDWLSLRVGPAERLLIVGTTGAAVDLARELFERRQELGVELVGFVDQDPSKVGTAVLNPGVVGHVADIPRIVRERHVDRVVVSLGDARGKLSMDQLLEMKLKDGVSFDHLASVYERYTGKIAVENLRPSWFIFSPEFRRNRFYLRVKRAMDLLGGLTGLLLASPLMLLTALGVRLTSAGPVFYHQRRVGQDGTVFTVHKFRSMRVDAEAGTGAVWAVENDPRVTAFGRFMRKTRLDELPQLWNVVKGDMSLVGPRPERPEFVEDLTQTIPFYGQRHVVKPGLTGWAQIRYAYGSTVEDALEKLQYDLYYIKNLSAVFDVYIMLETAKTVILRKGT